MCAQPVRLSSGNTLVRELLEYYKPAVRQRDPRVAALPSADEQASHAPSSGGAHPPSKTTLGNAPESLGPELQQDPVLTGIAQLGCFRLCCDRSFISLLDRDTHYVIAEATKSVSLIDPTKANSGDELYMGPRAMDLVWDVSLQALQAFTASDDECAVANDYVTINHDIHIIYDMSVTDGLKTRPFVTGWPYMKFYAAVPIISANGVIGIYSIVDNKRRAGCNPQELEIMHEGALTVVQHLELLKKQHDLERARGMVKGLGLFVEGKSGWWELENIGLVQRSEHSRPQTPDRRASIDVHSPISRTTRPPLNYAASEKETPRVGVKQAMSKGSSNGLGPRERKLSVDDTGFHEQSTSTGSTDLFSRASHLIRVAMGLDGVMFIGGCFTDSRLELSRSFSKSSSDALPTQGTPGTPGYETDDSYGHLPSSDLLGYSVRDKFNLGLARTSFRQSTLARPTLRGLLRDHCQGLIFSYNEDGSPSLVEERGESLLEDSTTTLSEFEHGTKHKWAEQLLNTCPGARTIIFFPLWDPQRDRWSAGGVAWTSNISADLRVEDIPYLTAFGRCIMTEKSRLEVLTADRAKTNFISSVSHELRSPLHGVLASAEALQETDTSFTQDDLIRTITVCGEVLLDTTDQILDYAKTSTSPETATSRLSRRSGGSFETLVGHISSLNMSNLVEMVVEGIFAGHSYRRSSLGPLDRTKRSGSYDSAAISAPLGDIIVIISIEWLDSWVFQSNIGSWKRILMNVFGNSLKYTDSGFVHVSLRLDKTQTSEHPPRPIAILQVDDSGKGVSKSYLKHRLYLPFAQEDPMSMGTGLGLSIVNQLVTDLSGKIDIQSEVGRGTTVTIVVPVGPSSETPETFSSDGGVMLSSMRSRCRGLTLCFIGFESEANEEPGSSLSPLSGRVHTLKSSLATYAVDWFGMNVATASSLKSARGDILIGLQSMIDPVGDLAGLPPLIIYEDHPEDPRMLGSEGIYILPQPVGPQKLARILGQCLNHKSSTRKSASPKSPQGETLPRDIPLNEIDQKDRDVHGLLPNANNLAQKRDAKPTEVPSPGPPSTNNDRPIESPTENNFPRRSRVLLVEDNITNMKILSRFMKKAKQEFVMAVDGLEAIQKYREAPESFKVIFMDIAMPVMDGLTSTRKIREHEFENSLPPTRIVALTCFSSEETQAEAFVSGMNMFLIKPVPMKALQPILDLNPDDVSSPEQGGDGTLKI